MCIENVVGTEWHRYIDAEMALSGLSDSSNMRNQRRILGIKWNESVSNDAVIPTTEREDIRMTV